ncbi:PAS-domain containing protein [Sphingomonas sp. GM_Shp_2]|uniref:hybrid sensor histidine kinase/response regulator n=1 Tax=Sphingomonas sp. GM_Shp_2 TaxID=2937380 RepID=UPI00226980D0|nr:PAS-domain containing protein [Sphingomonas sp. GM_Shp_2]
MSWKLLATISATYVAILFAIAWWGDRASARESRWLLHPVTAGILLSLTIAIYNTSWSFYGSVGQAARTGWGFMPIYVAPLLLLTVARPVLSRMIEAADAQGATSVADFLAGRYGTRQSIAALVTVGALAAVLPYIALQLKAVAGSFERLSGIGAPSRSGPAGLVQDTAFWLALAMALLIVVFGVRHAHRTERHRGLMIAVAFDSIVKLAAFLIVACAVVANAFGSGPAGLVRAYAALPPLPPPDAAAWVGDTLIAGLSFLCLPQIFHVLAVERARPGDLARAGWLFPLYLALLSIMMLPVAAAGVAAFGDTGAADSFMIALPLRAGRPALAVIAYVGGLSAATGMVIVATVALATMLCNDVIVPLILRGSRNAGGGAVAGQDVSSLLIRVRRIAVVAVLLLAYAMHRLIADYHLTQTGLVSFVGVAQFGPAMLAGLYWRRASSAGAVAGIAAGLTMWAWLLLLPPDWRPVVGGTNPIAAATFASLGINTALLALVSIAVPAAPDGAPASGRRMKAEDLRALAARFVGADLAETSLAGSTALLADRTRALLAGAIGISSARIVMAAAGHEGALVRHDARAILDEASEALAINHHLLRTVLDTIPQGICIFDANRCVLGWNATFLRLLDLPDGLVRVGLPLADLLHHNLSRARYAGSDPRLLLAPDAFEAERWPYVYERERPDGTVIEIAFDRLPDGGMVSTYSDVTERHHAAGALRRANEALEERVRERTQALESATAAAEAANLGKTRFLAAAGHDLLQPIHAARLFIATIESTSALPAPALRAAADAAAAIRSTETMIAGLSDLSAIDTGGIVPDPRLLSLDALLLPLVREIGALAEERGVSLGYRPSGLATMSDPALLRRIVQNYLVNALRHADAGRVILRCRARGASVDIQVWDDGHGIDPNRRAAIFEPFCRGERSEGMGLGLAIVQRMSRLLSHQVGVMSLPGRFACFFVRVPRLPLATQITEPTPAEKALDRAGRSLRLLCIDDDDRVQAALAGLCTAWGHRAEQVPSREPPDAIILDYHLKDGLTGIDLYDRLCALWGRHVPTLLVTADRSPGPAKRAAQRGINLLAKPIDTVRLREFVDGLAS